MEDNWQSAGYTCGRTQLAARESERMSDESLVGCRRLKDSAGGGKSHSEKQLLTYRTTGLLHTYLYLCWCYFLYLSVIVVGLLFLAFLYQFCSSVLCQ